MCPNLGPKQITLECGHIICPTCLKNKASPSSCCTQCWQFSQLKTLRADIVMYPEGETFWEIHREDQKLLCEFNQSLLCGTCSKSDNHRSHKHWPIPVAALKFRKKILTFMKTFHNSLEKRQIFFMEEKENSVTWAVVWTDPRTTTHEMYHKDICAVQNYIWSKEETEPLQEELILGDMNKKVQELYQHLKELEATQEYQIMKQKEAWEAMIATENRILMEGIKELAEKVRKPNVQVIQEFTQVSDVLFPR
ncbi:tripartite motif-containing protein 43-like [Phascolarctos cinereus]